MLYLGRRFSGISISLSFPSTCRFRLLFSLCLEFFIQFGQNKRTNYRLRSIVWIHLHKQIENTINRSSGAYSPSLFVSISRHSKMNFFRASYSFYAIVCTQRMRVAIHHHFITSVSFARLIVLFTHREPKLFTIQRCMHVITDTYSHSQPQTRTGTLTRRWQQLSLHIVRKF